MLESAPGGASVLVNGPVFKTGDLARERRMVGSIPMLRRRGVHKPTLTHISLFLSSFQ
jgi:hypothetical protein